MKKISFEKKIGIAIGAIAFSAVLLPNVAFASNNLDTELYAKVHYVPV